MSQEEEDVQEVRDLHGIQLQVRVHSIPHQHYGVTFAASTRCTTCSVNEQLGRRGAVVMNDRVHNGNIQTTCCYIRDDQHGDLVLLEEGEVINTA